LREETSLKEAWPEEIWLEEIWPGDKSNRACVQPSPKIFAKEGNTLRSRQLAAAPKQAAFKQIHGRSN
jgi:hypothetical protein